MNRVNFENEEELLEKLKKIDFLTKTKTIKALSQIVYKNIDSNGNIISTPCKIISYNWKENPEKCINKIYENLTIEVLNDTFDINIEYLKDMQKKSWGTSKEIEEA